ncbi:holocytochrome c synthetase - thiol:disulfide oxidoreductase CcmG [Rhodovastum atsumiense]|uniref:DsbE family thiol:disulfide interchange protein n=1 Tax=Rhodovastum atsumiense TaxID=504468 RepID=A0A5M6IRV7_9PROT|nr:DsbE family thiol:disulfide interchange protein [Rhodovastum atsumiense]KAA5611016.1 DsbE family thiol:disulfide interchange protein [Rhodovastum atsumiense]CAH2600200.1 holocytochrome c synthetase - thiol:disulfide oxidoreductase CcmG [Rhodovastum atsumiense]
MKRVLYLLPLVAFLAVAGYFVVALRPGFDPRELPSALIDKPAPDFDLPPLGEGSNLSRAGLAGQVAVVNFFASWCVPCRIEHPVLMRLARQEKLALYGIAYKDKPADAQRLLDQSGDPYRGIGLDLSGRTGIDFGVYGVPETYVIDKSGHIRKRFVGPLNPDSVERELLPLVRQLEGG